MRGSAESVTARIGGVNSGFSLEVDMNQVSKLIAAMTILGCTHGQDDSSVRIDHVQQEILNGVPENNDWVGLPTYGCSSSLLRPNWALTASHCAPQPVRPFGPKIGSGAALKKPFPTQRTLANPTAKTSMSRFSS
jgi:hypothetical protein